MKSSHKNSPLSGVFSVFAVGLVAVVGFFTIGSSLTTQQVQEQVLGSTTSSCVSKEPEHISIPKSTVLSNHKVKISWNKSVKWGKGCPTNRNGYRVSIYRGNGWGATSRPVLVSPFIKGESTTQWTTPTALDYGEYQAQLEVVNNGGEPNQNGYTNGWRAVRVYIGLAPTPTPASICFRKAGLGQKCGPSMSSICGDRLVECETGLGCGGTAGRSYYTCAPMNFGGSGSAPQGYHPTDPKPTAKPTLKPTNNPTPTKTAPRNVI